MADYMLSADGYAVVRKTPQGTVAASTLHTSSLNGGFTATAGTGGTLSVTSYNADFSGGSGGAEIKAVYDRGAPLAAGQRLEWVQIGNDNDPAPGFSPSPWLDNAVGHLRDGTIYNPNAPNLPFYTFTAINSTNGPSVGANALSFYDFSLRPAADLDKKTATHAAGDPITWSATLYPVIVSGTSLTVEAGITWGWTMKKAMVGSDKGIFLNPTPGSAVVSGVGTNTFVWGTPQPDSSSLNFVGGTFDAKPNVKFKLGTITYHNGTIASSSGADGVEFDVPITFDNVPEKNFTLKTNFTLINTANTDDPVASADIVQIGNYGYTFNVQEGATASADIYATLSTGLTVTPSGAVANSLLSSDPFDPSGNYTLNIVALTTPTTGGFITAAFSIDDRTSGVSTVSGGTPYTGPVSGLQYQYIDVTPDNLNITAGLANTFIHSGSGFDAIDVSHVSGTNVLDGGTNSNFLVGGTAAGSFDTFFVDDRGPSSDIWSTVANFHAGDAATIFGITPKGFNTSWVDGQGAAGFTGLTLHVTAPGVPTASLTLSGYSTADLTNGRLTTSFGTETDGTPYLYIHANT
jgi:hypothetical protein